MSEPFIGQINMWATIFAPVDWSLCEGQLITTASQPALFSLLGSMYGGDGRTNFALPDLRGRTPLGIGNYPYPGYMLSYDQGQAGGLSQVTLDTDQIAHNHEMWASSSTADIALPILSSSSFQFATPPVTPLYARNGGATSKLNDASISSTGGGQSHFNVQPSLSIRFAIAIDGIYPSRN
ncbi:phage tail protein [Shewanella sedimentimangrovi]|uniref:Tail fiber protein n=1 Tax=Shewanella sedimentimangrovi TaxID=2814293 RepID=A0ABX7R3Q0_9GAMM|nr:tail fiber protein [Shewanella sedimentimangrovi]QSX37416.1 tail fiber protein [Shewanella sedimentimangrovi]